MNKTQAEEAEEMFWMFNFKKEQNGKTKYLQHWSRKHLWHLYKEIYMQKKYKIIEIKSVGKENNNTYI